MIYFSIPFHQGEHLHQGPVHLEVRHRGEDHGDRLRRHHWWRHRSFPGLNFMIALDKIILKS